MFPEQYESRSRLAWVFGKCHGRIAYPAPTLLRLGRRSGGFLGPITPFTAAELDKTKTRTSSRDSHGSTIPSRRPTTRQESCRPTTLAPTSPAGSPPHRRLTSPNAQLERGVPDFDPVVT